MRAVDGLVAIRIIINVASRIIINLELQEELGYLKSLVRNKARPEGSIAEGYIAEESLTFCSRYIEDIETRFNRPKRVNDDPSVNDPFEGSSIFPQLGKPVGAFTMFNLTPMQRLQAHRYVLLNCALVTPFVDEFRDFIKRSSKGRRPSALNIEKRVNKEFIDWFYRRITNPDVINTMSTELKFLARGPLDNAKRWSGPRGIPKVYFDECFDTIIKAQFSFKVDEMIAKRPATLELCKRNKEIRKKQVIPHLGGSKANSKRRHEMWLEMGEKPSRAQLYIETHKRKDGSFVNDATRSIVEKIEVAMSDSTVKKDEISPNDALGKVLGPEHSGRVRCMGIGVTPTTAFRNTRMRLSDLSFSSSTNGTSSSSENQWQEKYKNL
ncbi:hypothetical protein RJT34_22229 [Clitoria ternatea]|uniref:DUF4218 domain-containing protein n=1 Tax=Clitoria ternatea TaxID=43366 RepID=A0AAN9IVE0_CLITE